MIFDLTDEEIALFRYALSDYGAILEDALDFRPAISDEIIAVIKKFMDQTDHLDLSCIIDDIIERSNKLKSEHDIPDTE